MKMTEQRTALGPGRPYGPVIPVLVLLALVLAACSGSGRNAAACDAFVAVDRAFSIDEDPVRGIGALEEFVTTAPDEVASQVAPVVALLQDDLEAAFESEELAVAEGAADQWALENCSDTRVDVNAFNYAFADMPVELSAGRVAFNLVNRSQTAEFHEALVLRAGDDVGGPARDALASALGDSISVEDTLGALEGFALVGASLVEPEGDTEDAFVLDLEPGDYILVCLLPVNSADLLEPYFGGEQMEGTRHFDEGMFADFTVTAG